MRNRLLLEPEICREACLYATSEDIGELQLCTERERDT